MPRKDAKPPWGPREKVCPNCACFFQAENPAAVWCSPSCRTAGCRARKEHHTTQIERGAAFRALVASDATHSPLGLPIDDVLPKQLAAEFGLSTKTVRAILTAAGRGKSIVHPVEDGLTDAQIAKRTAEILARAPRHRQELLRSAHAMWESTK